MPLTKDRFTRVTQVLDYFQAPGLVDWKLRVGKAEANRVSKAALKVGTRVDDLIKTWASPTKKDGLEVVNAYESWTKFCMDYGVKHGSFETCQRFWNDEEELTGEPDIYIPTLGLVDLKCANRISNNYWLQLAKYKQNAYPDCTLPVWILRLDKDLGFYEFVSNVQAGVSIPYAISVFDGLHTAYRYYNPGGESDDGDNS